MSFIEENVRRVQARIRAACERYGRDPADIRLLAVSKTKPVSDILEAHRAGLREFGENYLQEAESKIAEITPMKLEPAPLWHFIGPIQSNKTRLISRDFDWVHSVDRLKIARRLGEQRPEDREPLNILLQVNIDREPQKAGIDLDEIPGLAAEIESLSGVRLRGLMAIPAREADFQRQRTAFARLRELRDTLKGIEEQRIPLHALRRAFDALRADHPACDTLSMGMSGDLEAAIAEGSTLLRIGTALFGARAPKTTGNPAP